MWCYDEHVKFILVEVTEDAFFISVSSLDDEVFLVRYFFRRDFDNPLPCCYLHQIELAQQFF